MICYTQLRALLVSGSMWMKTSKRRRGWGQRFSTYTDLVCFYFLYTALHNSYLMYSVQSEFLLHRSQPVLFTVLRSAASYSLYCTQAAVLQWDLETPLTKEGVVDTVEKFGQVVHTVVPDKYCLVPLSEVGLCAHPVAIELYVWPWSSGGTGLWPN